MVEVSSAEIQLFARAESLETFMIRGEDGSQTHALIVNVQDCPERPTKVFGYLDGKVIDMT